MARKQKYRQFTFEPGSTGVIEEGFRNDTHDVDITVEVEPCDGRSGPPTIDRGNPHRWVVSLAPGQKSVLRDLKDGDGVPVVVTVIGRACGEAPSTGASQPPSGGSKPDVVAEAAPPTGGGGPDVGAPWTGGPGL